MINTALNRGANNISRLEYSLQNKDKSKEIILKKALDGLENKAKLTAKNLNYNNYEIKNLDINDHYQNRTINYNNIRKSETPLESKKIGTSISPGNIKIRVNVRGEFLMYDKTK